MSMQDEELGNVMIYCAHVFPRGPGAAQQLQHKAAPAPAATIKLDVPPLPDAGGLVCTGRMEQYGNQTTYNLETVLQQNIRNADFYRNDCMKLNSWSDIVDQIYYQVCLKVLKATRQGLKHQPQASNPWHPSRSSRHRHPPSRCNMLYSAV